MAISQASRAQRWKFLLVGFLVTALSTVATFKQFPTGAEAVGGIFGEFVSGLFWGWLVWLIWASVVGSKSEKSAIDRAPDIR